LVKVISDTPWYLFVLCISVGISLALLLYFKEKKASELSKTIQRTLLCLRAVCVTLICILLTNLFLKHINNRSENPIILVAIDNSTSIVSGKDSATIAKQLLQQIESLQNGLSKRFTIKQLLFGERTRLSDSISFKDKETDMANLLNDVSNNFSGQNIGALIIASDGIINKGANPVYSTEQIKYPNYTIALGDTVEKKDALIQKVNHNQVAYLGNQFLAEITLNAIKLNGEECVVSISKNNIKKGEQKVKISSQNFISTVNFILDADAPGVQKYTVNVSPVKGEVNLANNAQSFIVDVIDNRDKILLVSNSPHPDVSAISESIESMKNYELIKDFTDKFNRTVKPYSLVIIHGYNSHNRPILDECVSGRIPYLLINPAPNSGLNEIRINSNVDKPNDSEPALNNSFGLFTISEELRNALNSFPAVKTYFGKYTISNGAQILLNQRLGSVVTTEPILFFTELNGSKSGIFIGDGLWRWKLRDFQENNNFNAFNELISKTIQYLSVKSDKSFFRVYTQKIINENEAIEFNAEVYNKSYELITEPDVTMVIKNEKGNTFNYTFSKQGNAYRLALGLLPPGEYSYEAKTKIDATVALKKGILVVKPVISEKINTVADHTLLQKLSNATNGKMYSLNDLKNLETSILSNESIKPITYSQNETTELIDLKWIFSVLLILLSIEWFLRKYHGMI
jgi:hypothetical protein